LAHLIHERNSDSLLNPPQISIPLKGLILDSPWIHPPDQIDYTTVLYSYGLIDEATKAELEEKQNAISELLKQDNLSAAGSVRL